MMVVARGLQVIAWAAAFLIGSLVALVGMWFYWIVVCALGCADGEIDDTVGGATASAGTGSDFN